jgi:hypothetical protein
MFDEERLGQLVRQAWTDKALQATLWDDPTSYLRQNGIKIPDGMEANLQVDKDTISLRFEPQRPAGGQSELSESALNNVTGGIIFFQFKLVAVKTMS